MEKFNLKDLLNQAKDQGECYFEFLRVSDLSVGVYRLAAGERDLQSPHGEDEVYFVLAGRGKIRVADEVQAVEKGTLIYVPAQVEHKFIEIEEDLEILVFFAPAES